MKVGEGGGVKAWSETDVERLCWLEMLKIFFLSNFLPNTTNLWSLKSNKFPFLRLSLSQRSGQGLFG